MDLTSMWKSNSPEVDVVYLWADGSDADFAESLAACIKDYRAAHGREPDPESVGGNRFRDVDNLRHSLRSLEKNAPWFRRIFIVTNGQEPSWLRRESRVRIVAVDEVFPDRLNLPTFNATAIEWNIHRIPGLGRYFVFMNDDYFFTRPTRPDYFFGKNGLPKLLFSPLKIESPPAGAALWARTLANQARQLSMRFGPRAWCQPAHGPFFFDRVELARIIAMWPEQIAQTNQHRFRDEADLHLQVIYANAVAALDEEKDPAQRHERVVLSADQLRFISTGNPDAPWQAHLRGILKDPPRFLCLNDDGPSEDFQEIEGAHRKFLERLFPKPSSFEERSGKSAWIWRTVRKMLGR